jgi:hypothetical protein
MTILIEDPDEWRTLPTGGRVRRTQIEIAEIKSRPGRAEEDAIILQAIEILDRRQAEEGR